MSVGYSFGLELQTYGTLVIVSFLEGWQGGPLPSCFSRLAFCVFVPFVAIGGLASPVLPLAPFVPLNWCTPLVANRLLWLTSLF